MDELMEPAADLVHFLNAHLPTLSDAWWQALVIERLSFSNSGWCRNVVILP